MMRAGRLVMAVLAGEEVDGAERADDGAVHGERGQAVGLEEAHEEPHGEVRGDGRAQRADERGPADPVALRAQQLGQLERRGGADDRRGEQEREARGVLVWATSY